jgi:hypothetical protein
MSFTDIMKTDDGWYFCSSWCGREVTVRGTFCGHCAWMDWYMCVDRGINVPDAMIAATLSEIQAPHRGEELVLDFGEETWYNEGH